MEMNGTTLIKRPVEAVFAYVIDFSNDTYWRAGGPESGLKSEGPVGKGTIGFTRLGDVEAEWRVVSYVENESVSWDLVDGPYKGSGGYRLEPVNGGTKFTLAADVEPDGMYKLLGPLFGWIGRRQNQADVERLRELLEADPN
jgi:uncharacterized membrane protein